MTDNTQTSTPTTLDTLTHEFDDEGDIETVSGLEEEASDDWESTEERQDETFEDLEETDDEEKKEDDEADDGEEGYF